MRPDSYTTTFNSLPGAGAVLRELAERLVPSPQRILDIGCGTAVTLTALAVAHPHAAVVGVDVSQRNVEEARRVAGASGVADRASFVVAEYPEGPDMGAFDIVLADSVLHLIVADDFRLFARLARDVGPFGVLVATLPVDSARNRVLWTARSILRRVRRPIVDRLLLAIARRLHPDVEVDLLAERVDYMYRVPERRYGPAFRAEAEAQGLSVVESWNLPRVSIGQPVHVCVALMGASS